jgi:hypothetical protein
MRNRALHAPSGLFYDGLFKCAYLSFTAAGRQTCDSANIQQAQKALFNYLCLNHYFFDFIVFFSDAQ